jgi:hypothetical protein
VRFLRHKGFRLGFVISGGTTVLDIAADFACVEGIKLLAEATVRGIDVCDDARGIYWDAFDQNRDTRFIGLRAPTKEEKMAL